MFEPSGVGDTVPGLDGQPPVESVVRRQDLGWAVPGAAVVAMS
ncbi:hypothetical protein [Embleya sp. NBC_00896]|nr:hypothetical protein OG928_00670 [Embleya sp. NBC_00896]